MSDVAKKRKIEKIISALEVYAKAVNAPLRKREGGDALEYLSGALNDVMRSVSAEFNGAAEAFAELDKVRSDLALAEDQLRVMRSAMHGIGVENVLLRARINELIIASIAPSNFLPDSTLSARDPFRLIEHDRQMRAGGMRDVTDL